MKSKQTLRLSREAEQVLICLLMPISSMLIVTAFYVSSLDTYAAARFYPLFCHIMEHIMMALLITVGGTLLLDIELKRR